MRHAAFLKVLVFPEGGPEEFLRHEEYLWGVDGFVFVEWHKLSPILCKNEFRPPAQKIVTVVPSMNEVLRVTFPAGNHYIPYTVISFSHAGVYVPDWATKPEDLVRWACAA